MAATRKLGTISEANPIINYIIVIATLYLTRRISYNVFTMSIQDEIYEKFFSTLYEHKDFPHELIENLKDILRNEEVLNQQKLSELLEEYSLGDKDKED